MSLFDIDYNQQSIDLMPPDKRGKKTITLVQSLFKAVQWARDLILGSYKSGSTAPLYSPGAYHIYDQVIFDQKVFESLVEGNTSTPDDLTQWREVQSNFIGVDERIYFNGTKLVLEYALNKWFFTHFRQPNLQSDIYITTNSISTPVFRCGLTEDDSSSVGLDGSSEFVWNNYDFTQVFSFTIFIPVGVYNNLDANPSNRDAIIRNFADRYVTLGVFYNIQTY